jgi:hypothetical protein
MFHTQRPTSDPSARELALPVATILNVSPMTAANLLAHRHSQHIGLTMALPR